MHPFREWREEIRNLVGGPPFLLALEPPWRVRNYWSSRRNKGRIAVMETGGGGRSQREGEMDNVKYNREDGGAEGRRVRRVNQRPQA